MPRRAFRGRGIRLRLRTQSMPSRSAHRRSESMAVSPGPPRSIPPGLRVQLGRARILPNMQEEAQAWMAMLNDRLDEATETLARERTVLELAFLETDENGVQWVVWLQIQGEHGESITTSPHAIDADHIAYAEQCKEPGWRLAEPQMLLAPEPVRNALLRSAGIE